MSEHSIHGDRDEEIRELTPVNKLGSTKQQGLLKSHEERNKCVLDDDDTRAISDKCDCLLPACPGCHYPCQNCGSRFCGHVCKRMRSWQYVEVEIQGHDVRRTFSQSPDTSSK